MQNSTRKVPENVKDGMLTDGSQYLQIAKYKTSCLHGVEHYKSAQPDSDEDPVVEHQLSLVFIIDAMQC